MEFLEQLYGLGEQSAKELYKRLIRLKLITKGSGPDDVLSALRHPSIFPDLPAATRIDIMEQPDKQIPHEVLVVLNNVLQSKIHGIKFNIAGSFRRKKPVSRDVDITISRGSWKTSLSVWKSFVKQIHGNSVVKFHRPFAGGDDKLSVLVSVRISPRVLSQIKKNHPNQPEFYKRVWKLKTDVFVTPAREYMYMLLYATGSGRFNVMMRAQAKRKGYMLNQKGLFNRTTGKQIIVKNEKEIFNILGIAYRTPEKRI